MAAMAGGDRRRGPAFLGTASHALAPLAAARGAPVAGVRAGSILDGVMRPTDFAVEAFV